MVLYEPSLVPRYLPTSANDAVRIGGRYLYLLVFPDQALLAWRGRRRFRCCSSGPTLAAARLAAPAVISARANSAFLSGGSRARRRRRRIQHGVQVADDIRLGEKGGGPPADLLRRRFYQQRRHHRRLLVLPSRCL
jgi:hypothetical protein